MISASVRQIAGPAWANNNVNYFTESYPDKVMMIMMMIVMIMIIMSGHHIVWSVFAGGLGVVSGGWIMDRLQKR